MIQPRKDGGGKDGKISCIENDNCSTKNLFQTESRETNDGQEDEGQRKRGFPPVHVLWVFITCNMYIFMC